MMMAEFIVDDLNDCSTEPSISKAGMNQSLKRITLPADSLTQSCPPQRLHMPTRAYLCMPSSTPCLRISNQNRERLNDLKMHPKESYDAVIGRLLDRMTDPDPLTEEDRLAIAESLEEIRNGKYYTLDEAKKELRSS